jgi:hypothetical protein
MEPIVRVSYPKEPVVHIRPTSGTVVGRQDESSGPTVHAIVRVQEPGTPQGDTRSGERRG